MNSLLPTVDIVEDLKLFPARLCKIQVLPTEVSPIINTLKHLELAVQITHIFSQKNLICYTNSLFYFHTLSRHNKLQNDVQRIKTIFNSK